MIEWVLPGALARASQPGYGAEAPAPEAVDQWFADVREAVDQWLAEARALKVRSILCLLATELDDYARVLPTEGGLLRYYRTHGFAVHSVPVVDHAQPPLTQSELSRVAEIFLIATKPLVIHCSAGVDRTGAAIAHILRVQESKEHVENAQILLDSARQLIQDGASPAPCVRAPRVPGKLPARRSVVDQQTYERANEILTNALEIIERGIATAPDAASKLRAVNLRETVFRTLRVLEGDDEARCWRCDTMFWRNKQSQCGACGWNNCPNCSGCGCGYRR